MTIPNWEEGHFEEDWEKSIAHDLYFMIIGEMLIQLFMVCIFSIFIKYNSYKKHFSTWKCHK